MGKGEPDLTYRPSSLLVFDGIKRAHVVALGPRRDRFFALLAPDVGLRKIVRWTLSLGVDRRNVSSFFFFLNNAMKVRMLAADDDSTSMISFIV